MLRFFWYSKCSTCRKAKRELDAKEIAYQLIDITESPPSARELKRFLTDGDIGLKQLLNTSGQEYRRLGLSKKLPHMKQSDVLSMLAGNGRLLKRPILTDGNRVTVGFRDPAAVVRVWNSA